ncbi:DUF6597 domain-containing transcriptional factor [Roseivirga sp.]|uniref:DUF6597 domain-containing transcriptional factor n=1 Tax=Roseivirga sp. TaxID=1964215 RepID=UPI003B52BEAE
MHYQTFTPCDELKDYISHFWVGTWDSAKLPPHETYYIVANSLTDICFAFNSDTADAELLFSLVRGQTNKPLQVPVKGFYHLIGVAVYPYALPSLINLATSDLSRELIGLDDLFSKDAAQLNQQMAAGQNVMARIEILSDFLKSLVNRNSIKDRLMLHAVKQVIYQNGHKSVVQLADDFCLSQKQFYRRFKEFSGFNPKLFSRIVRFEAVTKSYPFLSNLTEVAYLHGYYDQAHLIHEFQEFTGFNPTEFWKLAED